MVLYLKKFIVVGLIACLVTDPTLAAARPSGAPVTPFLQTLTQSSFRQEALTLPQTPYLKPFSMAALLAVINPIRRIRWTARMPGLTKKDIGILVLFFLPFAMAVVFAYVRWNGVESDLFAELKSYALITGTGGLSGGLIAQWLKHRRIEWGSVALLIFLNIFYSTFAEKPLYGNWLEQIHGFWGIPASLVQLVLDLFAISLFYTDPAAFAVYSTYLDPRLERHAREEISQKFLGFYVKYGWVWGVFLGMALFWENYPVISYGLLQTGILIWNVAFEHDRFPTSQDVLAWTRAHRATRRFALIIQGIMRIHAHPLYFFGLRWTVIAIWLNGVANFLYQLGMSGEVVAAFTISVVFTHLAFVLTAWWQRLKSRPSHFERLSILFKGV